MSFRPTHRQLEYVVALDDERHFGRAASRCHVSQPTLSIQVALLEKQLGATLFDRMPGVVEPTPLGRRVVATARSVLASLDDIVAEAKAGATNLGGLIRLGVAPTFGPYFLPRLLPTIHRTYPDLQLYIREDRPTSIERDVLDGVIDCGLGPSPRADRLVFRPLCEEGIFLGVPAGHRLDGKGSAGVEDLRGERLLTLGRGHRLFDSVRDLAAASGAVFVEDYEGTSLDAIRQMVSIGMGCSLFPELYVRSEFRRENDVLLVPLTGWSGRRSIGFFWRENSGRLRHFEKLAAEGDAIVRALALTGDPLDAMRIARAGG
jgi:LysR family transcriptional regulator, hydrogen peroxide-inducible genes activator